MVYLHEKQINGRLCKHWANEVEAEDPEEPEIYLESTYKIKQVETGIIYVDATDIIPCKYTYEIAKDETGNPVPVNLPEPEAPEYEEEPVVEETIEEAN